jgi:hypothetical protein
LQFDPTGAGAVTPTSEPHGHVDDHGHVTVFWVAHFQSSPHESQAVPGV